MGKSMNQKLLKIVQVNIAKYFLIKSENEGCRAKTYRHYFKNWSRRHYLDFTHRNFGGKNGFTNVTAFPILFYPEYSKINKHPPPPLASQAPNFP